MPGRWRATRPTLARSSADRTALRKSGLALIKARVHRRARPGAQGGGRERPAGHGRRPRPVGTAGRHHPGAIYDFAVTPCPQGAHRRAKKSSVTATGGYGRGELAPGSDIDLLFVRPSTQTGAEGESGHRIHSLHAVGPGPEGRPCHAQRRPNACGWPSGDVTIRTALLEARLSVGRPRPV